MDNSNTAYTENGAVSLASTLDPRLNLFVKTVRDVGSFTAPSENQQLYTMIDEAFAFSPLDTMKILMNWRDCRGGKGDHRGFLVAMAYVATKYPKWFFANYQLIHEYGSYLDYVKLWHLVDSNDAKEHIMTLLVQTLQSDNQILQNLSKQEEPQKASISLLAKWLPSEKYKWDRFQNNNFMFAFCRHMFNTHRVDNEHLKKLRREYIVPLRSHLDIVEKKMCAKQFASINYEHVPSVAMKKYKDAFRENDTTRFNKYIKDVVLGNATIKSSQVYPHELVRHYLTYPNRVDGVIEAQWNAIKERVQASGAFNDSISVCDVSGSMEGVPMEVSIALGLLGMNENRVITFSESPTLHYIKGTTLGEQVQSMRSMDFGYNTDFERLMDLVLGLCTSKKEMKRVFIFSDMQFDVAMNHNSKGTHFERMKDKFAKAGVTMPQIVFWNLRGHTKDFPVKNDERGIVLLSGYSPSLLTSLIEGNEVTPLNVMLNTINAPRYNKVRCIDQL